MKTGWVNRAAKNHIICFTRLIPQEISSKKIKPKNSQIRLNAGLQGESSAGRHFLKDPPVRRMRDVRKDVESSFSENAENAYIFLYNKLIYSHQRAAAEGRGGKSVEKMPSAVSGKRRKTG